MTDIFDNGNAAVFDFPSIAAYVNRKPQPLSAQQVYAAAQLWQLGA